MGSLALTDFSYKYLSAFHPCYLFILLLNEYRYDHNYIASFSQFLWTFYCITAKYLIGRDFYGTIIHQTKFSLINQIFVTFTSWKFSPDEIFHPIVIFILPNVIILPWTMIYLLKVVNVAITSYADQTEYPRNCVSQTWLRILKTLKKYPNIRVFSHSISILVMWYSSVSPRNFSHFLNTKRNFSFREKQLQLHQVWSGGSLRWCVVSYQ